MLDKKLQIRNSTTDFLVFTKQAGEDGIEVRVFKESVWLTQRGMAQLFDCSTDNIGLHLKNIYASGELTESATTEDSSVVQNEGTRKITRKVKFYNLDAIISVGYRINSVRATQFRQWATKVLKTFAIQGYVLDKNRLENGQVDYTADAVTTKEFFATVQNKLHYAIHGHTAAELIMDRADHKKEHMGLTTWKNAPSGKIVKSDVIIAKNYLTKNELKDLNQFVTMYLDYAERQARRHIPMTMEDWAAKLDVFLQFNEEEILHDKGRVTAEIAKSFAESEFEKYRVIQDKLFESDFDRLVASTEREDKDSGK